MIRSWLADQGLVWGPGFALMMFLLFFVAMLAWVYRPGSRRVYDQSAMMPLEDGSLDSAATKQTSVKEQAHG
ncbi:MAG: cbb3-type cytochrome c oxidase subunit 3 [Deltaproteobacteria bacterium]|nr:cbb3-type cytochrome c oxidase subunit 3 [Deltaproteobacteria bacterium]